ncbi:AsnC family transcriptional regulator [Clostridia bacterium]|nr:AsnC family transcriptional regulator [Clostridia bacterium]
MKISTKGRYALRVMADLAMNDKGDYISLKEVATRQEVPIKYLEQIIPLLSKAGYLKSTRGNNGGYRLSRQPRMYTVGDILRAAEGSLAPVACLDDPENVCERQHECITLEVWEGLYRVINEYLNNITLEAMVENYRLKQIDNYCI